MQRPSMRSKTQQQRARRIFVRRIILDHLGFRARLTNFHFTYIALHHAPEGVAAEFKFSSRQLLLNN